MATKTRRRTSESERDERRRSDRERLQQAAEELLTSEGWERWVRVRSRNGLARYSVNNQLLIASARPDPRPSARRALEPRCRAALGSPPP
jgi:flagellar motor protein MotB